jgi:signal transduction histidine kinase
MAPLVAETIEALRPLLVLNSLTFESQVPEDLPDVSADPARLQQVFANLFSNAVKFTPPGGTIRVGAGTQGQSVRLWIADSGPGISAKELPHVFDRFWQARRTARLGTGLGLFIVKGIIEAHGGTISIESEVGAGTTIFLTLPIADRDAQR